MRNSKLPYLNDTQLEALVETVKVSVYGDMTKRGASRKEVETSQFEFEVEVPKGFHFGHIKTAANKQIKREGGIRARSVYIDGEKPIKQCEHRRHYREFMSDGGLRENERIKKKYVQEQQAKQENTEEGVVDNTDYGADGLPRYSDKLYVA